MSYPDDTLSLQRDSEKEGKATAHGDVVLLAALAEQAALAGRRDYTCVRRAWPLRPFPRVSAGRLQLRC